MPSGSSWTRTTSESLCKLISLDVSRICDIIAHDLARTHVSYYNDDAKRTKGMYRQRIQKANSRHCEPSTPRHAKLKLNIVLK